MTKDQMQMLDNMEKIKERIICGKDMTPHLKDRTLLYGYTCDRETFHVYMKNQNIHVVIYKSVYDKDKEGKFKVINMGKLMYNPTMILFLIKGFIQKDVTTIFVAY